MAICKFYRDILLKYLSIRVAIPINEPKSLSISRSNEISSGLPIFFSYSSLDLPLEKLNTTLK